MSDTITIKVSGVLRRSLALIESGDTYIFNALPKEAGYEETDSGTLTRRLPTPLEYERIIRVLSISVTGNVAIRIDSLESGELQQGNTLHSLPYDLALKLIQDHIWQSCEVLDPAEPNAT